MLIVSRAIAGIGAAGIFSMVNTVVIFCHLSLFFLILFFFFRFLLFSPTWYHLNNEAATKGNFFLFCDTVHCFDLLISIYSVVNAVFALSSVFGPLIGVSW